MPGGKVEEGETLAAALVREMREDTEGTSGLVRRRRMYANDVPVQMATSHLPAALGVYAVGGR